MDTGEGKVTACGEMILSRLRRFLPLIVLANMLGWFFILHEWGFTLRGLAGVALFSLSLAITVIDLASYLIPNVLVVLLFAAGAGYHWLLGEATPASLLLGLLLGVLFPLVLLVASRGGVGGGDVKLCGAMGVWLGFPEIMYALFIGALAGSLVSIFLLVWGIKKKKEAIPFGPFLVLGLLAVFFF